MSGYGQGGPVPMPTQVLAQGSSMHFILPPGLLPQPCGKPFKYEEFIPAARQDALTSLTKLRDTMALQLSGIEPPYSGQQLSIVIASLEAYAKPLHAMVTAAPDLKVKTGPIISWKSGVRTASQPTNERFQNFGQAINFELCMVLCSWASALVGQAGFEYATARTAGEPGDEGLEARKIAIQAALQKGRDNCARAAGIYQWLKGNIPESIKAQLPPGQCPEADVALLNALEEYASMCLAACNYELALRKGTSPSLLAKIAKKVAEYSSSCQLKLRVEPGLNVATNHAVVLGPLYLMMTWAHMANAQVAADKYGEAAAYALTALKTEEQLRQTLQALPALALRDVVDREVPSLAEGMKTIRHDNEHVYFGVEPKEGTLPVLHGVVVKAPEKYEPPTPPLFSAAELLPGLAELAS